MFTKSKYACEQFCVDLVQIQLRLWMIHLTGIPSLYKTKVRRNIDIHKLRLMTIQGIFIHILMHDVQYVNTICCLLTFNSIFMVMFLMSPCSRHSFKKIIIVLQIHEIKFCMKIRFMIMRLLHRCFFYYNPADIQWNQSYLQFE